MTNITHRFSSNFMGDVIPYSAHIGEVLNDFKDKFPGLESLHVEIKELLPHLAAFDQPKSIVISEDRSKLVINLSFMRVFHKNKPIGKVSQIEFFDRLRFIMNRAILVFQEGSK